MNQMRKISLCLSCSEAFPAAAGPLPHATVLILLLLAAHGPACGQAYPEQTAPDRYLVWLKDKENNAFSTDDPSRFLSARALERRQRQGIPVTWSDLPVTHSYVDSIRSTGVAVLHTSRWFNAVTIRTTDTAALERISRFSFVQTPPSVKDKNLQVKRLKMAESHKLPEGEHAVTGYVNPMLQVDMLRGNRLHELGYNGEGIQIAILDDGFAGADVLQPFGNLWAEGRILGTRDFVDGGTDVFDRYRHGSKVLSIIGAEIPGLFRGTATGASFWLLRTEDSGSEYVAEEDNWIAAAEFADSAGVDIINTSLGYTVFDEPSQDHRNGEMNGRSTRISVAAGIAASRGMLVIVSAGNEGDDPWHYISAPADADSILSVGASDASGRAAPFSGRGPSSDGRIKPDLTAMGVGTCYIGDNGAVWQGNGTSLSAPVVTGLAACLWQARKPASAMQVRTAIIRSSDRFLFPDTLNGYGIPDFNLALVLIQSEEGYVISGEEVDVFPNPFLDELYILFTSPCNSDVAVNLCDLSGRSIGQYFYPALEGRTSIRIDNHLQQLQKGMYMLKIQYDNLATVHKLIR